LIRLLDSPNPWMSRGQLWGTVVMDRALAGNAYLLKARVQGGLLKGAVAELWRLRPDRIRIIPSTTNFIESYEYNTGREKIVFPPGDIIHLKTRNPLNDYYGMPPLMAIAARVDIDEYMKSFLRGFYERGGTGPGAILSVKQKLDQTAKDAIRDRVRSQFGGPNGMYEWLILDQAESTYQQLGLNRGLRDALPKELDAVTEARIAMAFGIPGSILGLLIGYESSSYANKRQDWQVFWDLTMTPLLSDLDDALNLQLVPDFGGIDEVLFDLSDIHALQEDVDKIHDRERQDFAGTGSTLKEFREALGKPPDLDDDDIVLIPANAKAVRVGDLAKEPEPVVAPAPPEQEIMPAAQLDIIAEVYCPKCGRWLGRNMNADATAYCPKCKAVDLSGKPTPLTVVKTVERDEDGRVARVVEVTA